MTRPRPSRPRAGRSAPIPARSTPRYRRGWHRYDAGLVAPRRPGGGVSRADWDAILPEYYLSANYVKAAEDKTFPGAVAAALASPWGQAISAGDPANTYFGSYREVFARDLYEAWTSLFLAGDRATARDMTEFLFERQQLPDGSMPRNSLTNGKPAPDTFNTQLDECSYPLVMALAVGLTGRTFYEDHIRPAANFVISHGPSFGPERWEEQSGFSPSTIAAEIAGLIAAARIADLNHDARSAAVWRGVADEFQRDIKGQTVTTNGPLSPRAVLHPPVEERRPERGMIYNVGNGGPDLDQRAVIDAGFLELARLGVLPTRRRRHRPLAGRRRRDDPAHDRLRHGVLPLQRRRLRRRRHGRPPVGAVRQGQRPPLAGPRRRARPVRGRHGRPARGARPPAGDARHGLRGRPDPRAGVGAARPRALAVRDGPDARVDRLRQRQAGRGRRRR